ncbi:hypothetical protein CtCNB1_3720 [Comamonas thiooxydans]|nr:hypothetical protein CtCNB1_3720 [Comamonas thiooxydans]
MRTTSAWFLHRFDSCCSAAPLGGPPCTLLHGGAPIPGSMPFFAPSSTLMPASDPSLAARFLSLDVSRPETCARITGARSAPIAYRTRFAIKNKAPTA